MDQMDIPDGGDYGDDMYDDSIYDDGKYDEQMMPDDDMQYIPTGDDGSYMLPDGSMSDDAGNMDEIATVEDNSDNIDGSGKLPVEGSDNTDGGE